jgi:hypothetical protein
MQEGSPPGSYRPLSAGCNYSESGFMVESRAV